MVLAVQPSALSVPVRNEWLGDDGNWSPVSIRVGTPPQWVNVFPSTASQETWVVGPGGCDSSSICKIKRGGLFQSNTSSTWQRLGYYELGLDPQLGFGGAGAYGLDSVALSDQVSVNSQIVGIVNDTDYWLGYLGLGIKPSNFTEADTPTFLSSLANQSIIPSHSYGYTAGAYYRLKHVPASLVLGGYDTNRFVPHNVSFTLASSQNPVVSISNITVSANPASSSNISNNWSGHNAVELFELSDAADLYTIDSSTPYLWLPNGPCTKFEQALGLIYDENVQLYTFGSNTSQHDALISANLTFEFTLTDLPGSSNTVIISLPYKAFDMRLTYPYPGLNATASSPATNYFPIRKSANSTQLTIGRVLLQESYLIVDYERHNFSISSALFADNAIENINLVSITSPYKSTSHLNGNGEPGTGLNTGTKVSIAVATILFVCVVAGTLILCRRRRSPNDARYNKKPGSSDFRKWFTRRQGKVLPAEFQGSERFAAEASNEAEIKELPVDTVSELPNGNHYYSPYAASGRKLHRQVNIPIDHDPRSPVELQVQTSGQAFCGPDKSPQVSPFTETFAYSPDSIASHGSKGVSSESSGLPSPGISPSNPKEVTLERGFEQSSVCTNKESLSYLPDHDEHRGRMLQPVSQQRDSEGIQCNERQRFSWETQ